MWVSKLRYWFVRHRSFLDHTRRNESLNFFLVFVLSHEQTISKSSNIEWPKSNHRFIFTVKFTWLICNWKHYASINWTYTYSYSPWLVSEKINPSIVQRNSMPMLVFCIVDYRQTSCMSKIIIASLSKHLTTLQSMMNAKLIQHRFWPCHENGLIKTTQMIPHNLYEFQVDFPLLRIKDYPSLS